MKLHEGKLFWQAESKEKPVFQTKMDPGCYDAVIIGGGMSGALCAYVLSSDGMNIALVDEGEIGGGSTSANTGLLQYSNDIMLHELIEQIGEKEAVHFYKLCVDAVKDIQKAAARFSIDAQFFERSSLYYASSEDDVTRLQKEYDALSKHGFAADYWDRGQIESAFSFSKPAAIVTHGDAEVNPLLLCRGAALQADSQGADIFEHTRVDDIEEKGDNIFVHTSAGCLHAKQIVFATGYKDAPHLHDSLKILNRTYAIATEPIDELSGWTDRMMIWETKRPYLYMRLTEDNRIICGGLDEDCSHVPYSDKYTYEQGSKLLSELKGLFPHMNIELFSAWAALFGESSDNLPVIGRHPENPRFLYLLGLGGNGTVYSMLGSKFIRDMIKNGSSADEKVIQLKGRLKNQKSEKTFTFK